jgi:hypothetical protein
MITGTEWNIQKAIGCQMGIHNIVIPNLKLDYGKYEADLIYITENNYVYEIEIKIDFQDFKRDFQKCKYHDADFIRGLYYALPKSLYKRKEEEINAILSHKNPNAGIIVVDGLEVLFIKRCKPDKEVPKLNVYQKVDIMRLGCMKWWKKSIWEEGE